MAENGDRMTSLYRGAMTLIGTAILSVLGYVAITFTNMEKELAEIKTGYAIQIPALQKAQDKLDANMTELWRQFYQSPRR